MESRCGEMCLGCGEKCGKSVGWGNVRGGGGCEEVWEKCGTI